MYSEKLVQVMQEGWVGRDSNRVLWWVVAYSSIFIFTNLTRIRAFVFPLSPQAVCSMLYNIFMSAYQSAC